MWMSFLSFLDQYIIAVDLEQRRIDALLIYLQEHILFNRNTVVSWRSVQILSELESDKTTSMGNEGTMYLGGTEQL